MSDAPTVDSTSSSEAGLSLCLEFRGGVELLIRDHVVSHSITLPPRKDGSKWLMRDLLLWTRDTLIHERPELFLKEDAVRPGILVLINDEDWELLDGPDYPLCAGDTIVFISTLHGG